MRIKTPSKLMLLNFCLLVVFYIYLWGITLNQCFYHNDGKTPYIIIFVALWLIGLWIYKIWFAFIKQNRAFIIISGFLLFLVSLLFYLQPDRWCHNVSFAFLYLGISFIIYGIKPQITLTHSKGIIEILKYIGVILGGFLVGCIILLTISMIIIEFYLNNYVGQDAMSQGIAGSIFLLCLGLPISVIGGIFSSSYILRKYIKFRESKKSKIPEVDPENDRGYILRFFSEKTKKEEFIPVQNFNIIEYQCGLKAGEYIKLKIDFTPYKTGETFLVLAGAQEDPSCLWLKDSKGENMTWDDNMEIFKYFEKISKETYVL